MDEGSIRRRALVEATTEYRPLGTFRLVLALLVAVSHLHRLGGPRLDFLAPLGLGNPGVMAFFVLSGFVIAEALDVFYRGRPGAFLVNRALRIYPPFFVALWLAMLAHWALGTDMRFFDAVNTDHMFDVGNVVANHLRPIVVYGYGLLGLPLAEHVFVRLDWAVVIEVQFYLVFAAFMAFAPRSRLYWPAVCALLLSAFVGSILAGWRPGMGWIPYFMLGAAIYRRNHALSALCLALVNWHAAVYIARDPAANVPAALALLNLLLVALWVLGRARAATRWKRLDARLGDLTYPIYLNHFTVGLIVLTLFRPGLDVFLLVLALTLIGSYAAMLLTDRLTRRLRDRIRGCRLS